MFIVQAEKDDTNPFRQIFDIAAAFQDPLVNVDPCKYVLTYVKESSGDDGGHALVLWPQIDPNNTSQTIGRSVLDFLHQNLD